MHSSGLQLFALALDAFHETLDKKSLQVVCGLSLLVVIAGACIGFKPIPFEELATREIPAFASGDFLRGSDAQLAVPSVRPDGDGIYTARIQILGPGPLRRMMKQREWTEQMALGLRAGRNPRLHAPNVIDLRPLTPEEVRTLFQSIGRSLNYGYLDHRGVGPTYEVRFRPPYIDEVSGGGMLSVAGLYEVRLPPRLSTNTQRSFADLILDLQAFVANWIAGFFGLIIALVFTGGLFPSMLQQGSIDLIASKPIHRVTLFCCKYLGGLLYVTLSATALIGGFWLVTSIRSGIWNFGFLLTIFSVMLLFAILYTVSVFWAVVTRSSVTAILLTLLCTFLFMMTNKMKEVATQLSQMNMLPDWLLQATQALYWILPAPGDFDLLNAWFIAQAPISSGLQERFLISSGYFSATAAGPLWMSIGSSVLFGLVVFFISCTIFCRKDF